MNFTTKSSEAFTFWRRRADCRELACVLLNKRGVLQIGVTPFEITAWWPLVAVSNWSAFGNRLPSLVAMMLELADALDEGHGRTAGRGNRRCGRCRAALGRSDVYCGSCGTPWWEEKAARDQRLPGA